MINELRFALRQLWKTPGFTTVALLTLALGIGANTAIFSVVDQLLARPLPVPEPNRIALVAQARQNGNADFEFNYPLFRDYQRDNTVFSDLSATGETEVGLGLDGITERQKALLVSGNYFRMLKIEAALGRTFAVNEGVEIDDAAVVVLGHGLWTRKFGADPQVLGRTVTLNGRPFTVIGIAPREFTGTTRTTVPDLYVPITTYGQLTPPLGGGEHPLRTRFFTWHSVLGRLKPGVSFSQAQAAMQTLTDQYNQQHPPNTPERVQLLSGAQGFTQNLKEARLPMRLLLATAGLVLLIACANLANLQLARATGRARDLAIRLALGASRGRVMRELVTESLLLASGGGALGVVVAVGLVEQSARFRPVQSNLDLSGHLDLRVLGFTLGITVVTGLLFGLLPAWRASRFELVPELKRGGAANAGGSGRQRLRATLVVFQIALSLLVLVSAGLCLRSLNNLQRVDPGFQPSQVVLMSLDLGLNQYGPPQASAFYERLLERVRTLPGVEAAGLGLTTPLSGQAPATSVERVEGYQPGPQEHPFGEFNVVTPDFFRALGVPLRRGRDFTSADRETSPAVVVVNEAFAQRYWPGQDPVGKRIFQHGPNGGSPTEVVGVVGSTSSRSLTDSPRPALYFPVAQKPDPALTLVVRTALPAASTLGLLRESVKALDPAVPVFGLRTMAEQRNSSLAMQRMAATMLTGFGLLALLLAALGIYGVLAYSVSCRTREIGVRMALGAQVTDVLGLVLRQGGRWLLWGFLLGLAGAWAATRGLRSFLFQVQPLDPLTVGGVMALLGAVTALACWLPARRAARVDPIVALRSE